MIMPVKYTDSIIAEALDMRANGIKNVVIVEKFGPGVNQAIRKYKARCANKLGGKRMSGKIEISREQLEKCLRDAVTIRFEDDKHVLELSALLAAPVVERQAEWQKLDKSAMVGCTRFSKGVSSRLVIEAAQRNYEYQVTPEKEAERIANGTAFLETLQDFASPPAPVAVVLPDRKPQRITDAYAEGWNACLDKVKELNQ